MQKNHLENFANDLDDIRKYIKHIDLINAIEQKNRDSTKESLKVFSDHLHSFGKAKKLFEYKAIIISLYGILERHIGIWIKEHVETISKLILDYEKLPKKINQSHFELSINLISMISENRFAKYDHLTKENVLIKLSSCISNPKDYSFNSDAFSPRSGNLKHSKIVEAFKPLDIELESMLKSNGSFSIYLKNKFGDRIANKGPKLFNTIDDLVNRRNDIAHGIYIDSILNITEFDDYIEFLENYGKAIFEVIIEEEIKYESIHLYKKIDRVKGVFKKGSILGFEIEDSTIEKGDFIIVKTYNNHFLKKEILEIQINGKSADKFKIVGKIDIGVFLGSGLTSKQTFYIKR